MNILITLHSHICGGIEKHVLSLLTALKEAGHNPAFAGPLDSWLGFHAEALGIARFHVPMHGFYDLHSLYRLTKAAKATRADVIHGHSARGSHYAGWASALTGIPAIATAHSTHSHKHFKRTGKIIAVSDAVRHHLVQEGYPPGLVRVIHSGVPTPGPAVGDRSAVRAELGLADDQTALCLVARFIRDKGQDLALSALAGLGQDNLRLFLVGEAEGPWFAKVQGEIAAAGLERRVVCLGHREDVGRLLAGMDIFLAPSRREALSLSILEACAAGLPIVAAWVGGIPEIIVDGENGLLFPSEDAGALERALRVLIENPARRDVLGRNARATFLGRFGITGMVNATLDAYLQLRRAGLPGYCPG